MQKMEKQEEMEVPPPTPEAPNPEEQMEVARPF